jgi:hypothetical protein
MNRFFSFNPIGLVALGLALALSCAAPAAATTVIEKDLAALCNEADRVFVGTVSSVQSQWTDPEQRHIETLVTFSDIEPLFGVDTADVVLRFSGGQVGDTVEQVEGMPAFHVGDRDVIFARNAGSVSPIVGFNQGCLHVDGTGSGATVALPSYQPIGMLGDRRVLSAESRTSSSMSLNDFLSEVRGRLEARGTTP